MNAENRLLVARRSNEPREVADGIRALHVAAQQRGLDFEDHNIRYIETDSFVALVVEPRFLHSAQEPF